jgi:HEAT repeat protein
MARFRRVTLISLFCLLALTAFAQQPGEAAEQDQVEQWRDVLRYGIDSEVQKVIKSIAEGELRSLDSELVELFRQSLNTEVRVAILELFERNEIRIAEQPALALVRNPELEDPALTVAVIRYLSAIGSAELEPELVRLIEEGSGGGAHERVVEGALSALGKVGGSGSGALLLDKLEDPEYPDSLKPEIILALGTMKYEPAVEALIAIAGNRDLQRVWRMYAAVSLGEIGDDRAVEALKELFREQDSLLKVYAASALAHFGMREVEGLLHQGLRDSNERVRATAAKALGNPQAVGSVDILIYKARNDPSGPVRIEAIRALGQIGTPAALGFLRELYGEKLTALPYREEALLALCDGDLEGSLRAITDVVDSEWASRDQKVIGFTARILSTREFPGLAGLYERFLGHPDVGVRIYALRGIANNRLRSLRSRVEQASKEDPHPAARRTALTVLERL